MKDRPQLLELLPHEPVGPASSDCPRSELLMSVPASEALGAQDSAFLQSHLRSCSRCKAALLVSVIDDGSDALGNSDALASDSASKEHDAKAPTPDELGEWRGAQEKEDSGSQRDLGRIIMPLGFVAAAAAVLFVMVTRDPAEKKSQPASADVESQPVLADIEAKSGETVAALPTESAPGEHTGREEIAADVPLKPPLPSAASTKVSCPKGTRPVISVTENKSREDKARESWCEDRHARKHGPYSLRSRRPGSSKSLELIQQRAYEHGVAHGTWTQWDFSGAVKLKGEFDFGLLVRVDGKDVKRKHMVAGAKRLTAIFERQQARLTATKLTATSASPGQADDWVPPFPTAAPAGLPKTVSRRAITTAMQSIRPEAKACAEKQDYEAPVTVKVKFTVDSDGKVAEARANSRTRPRRGALENCLERVVKKAKFPASQKGITVTYPFVFR